MPDLSETNHPVIFFDGICNLCTGSVQFIIKRDPSHYFRFASLQGETGQQLLLEHQLPVEAFGSFLLWEKGILYTKSTAALRVTKNLSGIWPGLYMFMIVPSFIRDSVYHFIAKNRYQWFGKQTACWIPAPELQQLFLD